MRIDSWPEELQKYIDSHVSSTFEYGSLDCALFASNWVKIATGFDPAKEFRGKYSTKSGSLKQLKSVGGSFNLFEVFDKIMIVRCDVLKAQRGDVIGLVENGDQALGICVGSRVVALGETGISFYDIQDKAVRTAWRV